MFEEVSKSLALANSASKETKLILSVTVIEAAIHPNPLGAVFVFSCENCCCPPEVMVSPNPLFLMKPLGLVADGVWLKSVGKAGYNGFPLFIIKHGVSGVPSTRVGSVYVE
jgi:hypothetical protein